MRGLQRGMQAPDEAEADGLTIEDVMRSHEVQLAAAQTAWPAAADGLTIAQLDTPSSSRALPVEEPNTPYQHMHAQAVATQLHPHMRPLARSNPQAQLRVDIGPPVRPSSHAALQAQLHTQHDQMLAEDMGMQQGPLSTVERGGSHCHPLTMSGAYNGMSLSATHNRVHAPSILTRAPQVPEGSSAPAVLRATCPSQTHAQRKQTDSCAVIQAVHYFAEAPTATRDTPVSSVPEAPAVHMQPQYGPSMLPPALPHPFPGSVTAASTITQAAPQPMWPQSLSMVSAWLSSSSQAPVPAPTAAPHPGHSRQPPVPAPTATSHPWHSRDVSPPSLPAATAAACTEPKLRPPPRVATVTTGMPQGRSSSPRPQFVREVSRVPSSTSMSRMDSLAAVAAAAFGAVCDEEVSKQQTQPSSTAPRQPSAANLLATRPSEQRLNQAQSACAGAHFQ